VDIQVKYQGYIDRQQIDIDRQQRYDHWRLPEQMDYSNVSGLSNEVREKLRLQRPETVGQASRIPGMTPAAVSLLLVHLKKKTA
jgi:tRNA uridine 5-carboxymethylaminomethyl modification enzyme